MRKRTGEKEKRRKGERGRMREGKRGKRKLQGKCFLGYTSEK